MEDKAKEKEVVAAALELFMTFGIKSLTMDDISRKLHMSKKSLYLYVSDKKDLVNKGVLLSMEDEREMVELAIEASNNAVDGLIAITKCVNTKLGNIHPAVIYDIQKYHPEAWKMLLDHKTEFVYGVMLNNLKRGVKEGYYRKNINSEVVASIYMILVENIMNTESELSKKMSMDKLHLEAINYHFSGICNKKGLDYLETIIKNEKLDILSID